MGHTLQILVLTHSQGSSAAWSLGIVFWLGPQAPAWDFQGTLFTSYLGLHSKAPLSLFWSTLAPYHNELLSGLQAIDLACRLRLRLQDSDFSFWRCTLLMHRNGTHCPRDIEHTGCTNRNQNPNSEKSRAFRIFHLLLRTERSSTRCILHPTAI